VNGRFEIPGLPVPKGRPRMTAGGHVYTPPRTRNYEESVAWHGRAGNLRFGDAPVSVRIELWVKHPLRGDLDNYAKAVLDGLVLGQVIDDDRQVVSLKVDLVVGAEEPRTVVHILSAKAAA